MSADNVLSMQQFKDRRWNEMLDSVQTPQEQLDALDDSIRRHPASQPKRAKLKVVKD